MGGSRVRWRHVAIASLLFIVLPVQSLQAQITTPRLILVIYPQTARPYRAVFDAILSGIDDHPHVSVSRHPLDNDADADTTAIAGQIAQAVAAHAPDAVITLGRSATESYHSSGSKLPQIVGAMNVSPERLPSTSGISLAVDPALLFATLRRLSPSSRRVLVVYDPLIDGWIIERAAAPAALQGLTLTPFAADDLRSAARHFSQILQTADPATDAIWLLTNARLVDNNTVLPVIIEQSWYRRLVVFSNNLSHADRGVLFALYPNDRALGRRLAALALQRITEPDTSPSIAPLTDVKRALNLRVANHLDLAIDRAVEKQFDLVFPAR